jgi:hypothetical protein
VNIWIKRLLFAAAGGVAGYVYSVTIGCMTGSCPITSNPTLSSAYGAAMGVVLTLGGATAARKKS